MTVARRFLLFLSATFLVVIAVAAWHTYRFSRLSSENARALRNLEETVALNQELERGVSAQINRLHHRLYVDDPDFERSLRALHWELGEKATQYLRLDIAEPERLAVEGIRNLHAELGVRATQMLERLRRGDLPKALLALEMVEQLGADLSTRFRELNVVQLRKLEDVLLEGQSNVAAARRAMFGLGGVLALNLIGLAFLFRQDVLRPLQSLQETSRAIRAGDLSARAPIRRLDEIGFLTQDFNFMGEALAQSYAGLEKKVEDRTRQLEGLQRQLVESEKMFAVGRLVSGVAHELNNPLASILGFAELQKESLAARGASPDEVSRVADIATEAERCRRIVANLLQFARRGEPHLESVRLSDVVERAVQLRAYELGTQNVTLVRDYDRSGPVLAADPHKLQQVALNLLNNARDAVKDVARPGRIEVVTRRKGDTVMLEVRDNGPGIQAIERIFEPFYTTKEVGKGTGLGLAVCYGIVQEHGGEIRAENLAAGACFRVTLPRGEPERLQPVTAVATPPPAAASHAIRRALVVDDEKLLVNLQVSFLSQLGIEATGVYSGEKAIHYMEEHDVDLVISDVRMPGSVDGLALREWIRENRPALLGRFLLVSGDVAGFDSGEFSGATPDVVLQKPFRFNEYARVVRQLFTTRMPS